MEIKSCENKVIPLTVEEVCELQHTKIGSCILFPVCTRKKESDPTCTSMLLMTCKFSPYQYRKECNLCSDSQWKRQNITTVSLANYWSITPVDVQQIIDPSPRSWCPAVAQSAQSSFGDHCGMEESWAIMYWCRNVFWEVSDVAVIEFIWLSICSDGSLSFF